MLNTKQIQMIKFKNQKVMEMRGKQSIAETLLHILNI